MNQKSITLSILTFLFFVTFVDVSAQDSGGIIIKVPEDFETIQSAINAASDGDTVLVATGSYKENINLRGKNIILTSYFGITGDVSFIKSTVIDGSEPAHPDTASCVLIISGEDSSAVLQGFTLTGGTGTKWIDEHGAGTYIEGGAILVTESSPTIRYNLIVNNEAIRSPSETVSAGGGAIRCGDSSPQIMNNVIINNAGMYGGGIVLNYCSDARISNNIINGNRVYEAVAGKPTFGGGGLWILETLPGNDLPNIITNNTIVGNSSNSNGSGIRIWNANTIVQNNIVWHNIQDDTIQVSVTGSNTTFEYNNVQNGVEGIGNINLWPSFADSSFLLDDDSPCIDTGHPDSEYDDIEDDSLPGIARWPSKGDLRNDMGAYGGPDVLLFSDFASSQLYLFSNNYEFLPTNPGESDLVSIPIYNVGSSILQIDSVSVINNKSSITSLNQYPIMINPFEKDNILIEWAPLIMEDMSDTLSFHTNEKYISGQKNVHLSGTSFPTAYLFFDETTVDLGILEVDSSIVDTTFYIHNYGTAADSVSIIINYDRVRPDSAMTVTPTLLEVEPKDSVAINVSIYPGLIRRSAFTNEYNPSLVLESKFSLNQNRFWKQISFQLSEISDINETAGTPEKFALSQNYPNPFNPKTVINYQLPIVNNVKLSVYNLLGQKVATLVDERQQAGTHQVEWDASGYGSGIYYYRIEAGEFQEVKKMILLR